MPDSTPNYYRFPLDSDPLADLAATVQQLANMIPLVQGGDVSVSVPATTAQPVTITFPVEFSAAPELVGATLRVTNPSGRGVSVGTPTKTGMTIYIYNPGASAVTLSARWHAVKLGAFPPPLP